MPANLDEFYSQVPVNQVPLYKAMAEAAIQLGYRPKQEKTKHLSIAFVSSKYRVTILKYACDRKGPSYRLKFFASHHYSPVFDRSIKETIEAFDFKYTGCYSCGKCKEDELEGYQVVYEDGRQYFRCGFELIGIVDLNEQIKDEVIELIKSQTAYYEKKLAAQPPGSKASLV